MMEKGSGDCVGLTTVEALNRLHQDIKSVVDEYESALKERHYPEWLMDTLHHKSRHTTLNWTSALALLISGFALLTGHLFSTDQRFGPLIIEGLFICVLVCLNFYLVAMDNKLRHTEIPQRIRLMLDKLKEASNVCHWLPENYPHLCIPYSPCITLQWTYRDGHLVNLPWALLVRGDVIVIRPGQMAPGNCVPVDDKDSPPLNAKEVYGPPPQGVQEVFTVPTARTPLPNKKYYIQETPYLNNLRMALQQALDRPVTYYNKERHLLMITCIEHVFLPVMLVCVLFLNFVRLVYLSSWVGSGHWVEMLILQPVTVSLPLLPIVFPAAWLVLQSLGMACIQAVLHTPAQIQEDLDPFEEADLAEPQHATPDIDWQEVRKHFLKVFRGNGEIPSRSANLLHVLASVTALCCVDKKGILSWPNPTAEKVFFLRNCEQESKSASANSVGAQYSDLMQGAIVEEDEDPDEGVSKSSYIQNDCSSGQTVAEVLDLTHDHTSPFRLQFDDHSWKQHLNSLKPLGLAILLNTCNMETQEHYTKFCSHVTCEALHNEDLVPVTNRRCLCELAKQIGFQDQAQDIFKLEEQLSTFRHVQPEMVRRDIKFARTLSIAKLKFPFPHMVAVVVREKSRGGLQLMSQGTADVILDSCVEYWDGRDLCPFSAADRKKVQDFYQRTSLTAYCTAFAYRPLTRGVNSRMSDVYLELPADSKHLYMPHRSPTPLGWDFRNVLDPRCKGILGQFHSTDSLLGSDIKEDDVNDVEGCFELQCNQVFIGMVTMQYQAQIDMVQLIEQLERACIRFVHFSKENELRSRVFSEKMGLESGWNCHISLLSERNRSDSGHSDGGTTAAQRLSSPSFPPRTTATMHQHDGSLEEGVGLLNPRFNFGNTRTLSFSAPSAINLEFSQVKFEDEIHDWFGESLPNKSAMSHRDHSEHMASQDSMMPSIDMNSQQEWRSLSCLTDSTEQSAPVNFDMSNRAKLPRGIDKIRPHLENIDNVPLLVSLFTDCTPSVTREMLHIMQEYGEVVCVVGSSANADNMAIFLQADASLAVEPLYPQVCQKIAVCVPPEKSHGPSPIELSRALNSIACSLSFCREDPISIFYLILESRHYMQCVWNCVQFWVCCVVSLSTVQFLGIFLLLPPLFSTGQVLWLVCLVIPLLSGSLVGLPTDPQVMQRATGKNQCVITAQVAAFIMWCYGLKFLPAVLSVLLLFGVTLFSFCQDVATPQNSTCVMVYPAVGQDLQHWGGWEAYPEALLGAQHAALILIVLQFITISVSFVCREDSIWRRSPHHNKIWVGVVVSMLSLQGLYSSVSLGRAFAEASSFDNLHIPWYTVALGIITPLLVFSVNELIKREEIKVNVRYQKKARLEFGTKLGMNSPF